jgi:hypothetical protein
MKPSILKLGLIGILVLAVTLAGCTGGTTQTPAATPTAAAGGQATQAPGGAQATAAPQGGGAAAGTDLTGANIFGTQAYTWVEYKMTAGSGADKMTIYYKYNQQTGKCSMRFEGVEKMEGMPTEMDCSTTGTAETSADPNEIDTDVKFVKVGTEVVTVPAGTFTADKYTATVEGNTATYWIVRDKPLIKMETTSADGSGIMELNGWG